MAMTSAQQTDMYRFFTIAFGAAPGTVYMDQLDEAFAGGMTTQQIVNAFTTKSQFTSTYPNFLTPAQFAARLVENVVGTSATAVAKAEAVADIEGALAAGATRGDVIYTVFNNLANKEITDATWGNTAKLMANQVVVAQYYTETQLGNSTDLATLRGTIANVTATSDVSTPAAIEALSGAPVDHSFTLTTGLDELTGTSLGDLFEARVVQNYLGAQVNQLGSGDQVDGGNGADILTAKVTAGVFAGGSYSMPIQAEITNVETIKFEAVSSDIALAALTGEGSTNGSFYGDNNTQVYVNAKDMTDVSELWSSHSDADLIVQNLTTVGLSKLSDMTIGMEYTGNADSRWDASDMTVYFDQDYLTPEVTRTNPVVDFLAMNEDNYDATNGAKPLDGVFFRELQFTLNGTVFDLVPYLGENRLGTGSEITTYTEFLAAVTDALVELKADNVNNAALQTVEASFGQVFQTDVDPVTLVRREGVAVRLTVDGLTNGVENTLAVASTDLEVARAAGSLVPNNNRYELADDTPPTSGDRLAINVALEKVGLAGDGGDLVIGSMNKTEYNEWHAVNTVTDTTSGIEEFNVIVYGANDKSSSLAGLHSTNNNLRVVTVDTDADQAGASFADLTIGNSNSRFYDPISFSGGHSDYQGVNLSDLPSLDNAAALKDVQTFDASGLKGDLTLFAALTSEVTDKYLNLVDQSPDAPALDNVNFEYTGGTGNDYFNIALDTNNTAFAGTVTREDFLMTATVDGGDGDDTITLGMVNSDGLDTGANGSGTLENWYINQKLLQNVHIHGGNGDDTIWTPGSGDVTIEGGADNDTVYADNTGNMSDWVLNFSNSSDTNDIGSGVNHSYNLFKTDVLVTFKGFEARAAIVDTRGVATDLDINQAVKKAINTDPVLSKLLVAQDGPANSLVITSLIDGSQFNSLDVLNLDVLGLDVNLETPTAAEITAGEALSLSSWYAGDTLATTPAGFSAYLAGIASDFNDPSINDTYLQEQDSDGSDSAHISDNQIMGGTGNDVLVLGTGAFSNDTLVYEGFGNGTDSIVNFVTAVTDVVVTPANTLTNLATVVVTDGTAATLAVPAVAEVFSVTLTGTAGVTPGAFVLDSTYFATGDVSVTPTAGDSAATVAAALIAANNGAAGHLWTASAGATAGTILFTQITAGAVASPTISNTLGTSIQYDGSGIGVTTANVTEGSNLVPAAGATAESFTVTFGNAAVAATYTFAGVTVPVLAGETGANIAAAFASAAATGWTDAHVADTAVVTYTSTSLGDITDETDASFVGANIFTDTTTTVITTTFEPSDLIDFSAYLVEGVVVDGLLIAGTTAIAGEEYVRMTESTTNDGSYTVAVYTEAGATDTLVGLIGVMDFGVEQDFMEENFII